MVSLIKVETLSNNIRITVDEYDAPPVVVDNTTVQNLTNTSFFTGLVFETRNGVPTVGDVLWAGSQNPPTQGLVSQSILPQRPALISGRQYEIRWVQGNNFPYSVRSQNSGQPLTSAGYFFRKINTSTSTILNTSALFSSALPQGEQFTRDSTSQNFIVPVPCYITVTVDNLGVTQITYDSMIACFAEDTRISTQRGEIKASQVMRGDVVMDINGMPLSILANVRFDNATRLFSRLTNPSSGQSLFIQGEHSILENGREIPAKDSIYAESVTLGPTHVHTFITQQRTFVNIQGFQVGTWSECAFDNFCAEDLRGQLCKFTTQ